MTAADPLFDRWQEAFATALRACPTELVEHRYAFAGHPVRLRVVGRALAAHIHAPFAHLAAGVVADTTSPLRIDLWDETPTGVHQPGAPDTGSAAILPALTGGTVTRLCEERIFYYARDMSVLWLDRPAQRIFGWFADGRVMPGFERTRPLPLVLVEWYRDRGVSLIHAGLVARGERGLLLAGWSGAGKSTAAVACLQGGLPFLGDDHIGLQVLPDETCLGHSVFSSVRLEVSHVAHFPRLLPHALPPDADEAPKSLNFLSLVAPAQLRACVPIRAIALPRVVDAPGCVARPASKGEALRVLGPSTLLGLPHRPGSVELRHIARLVAAVPVFWLEMGRDIDAIAPCAARVLDDLDI